ncbi:hypothetical protein OPT61_g66 [Boeremia exigua]|uniref:Uncharacterized protein n=1 Tax=Boeremia exigua TaxID=749465 RepID=A0ACC2IVC2_9PLEO|nr:hypothetical protein OPT61_g66 [Boeremia exigua]
MSVACFLRTRTGLYKLSDFSATPHAKVKAVITILHNMRCILLLFYSISVAVTKATICPILGPVFPPPRNLHTFSPFQDALESLQIRLDEAFKTGNTTYGPVNPEDTYSIQIFSTESGKLLDYHRRGSTILGNRPIDGDSIYRIASVSKLLTVYLLLLEAGESILAEKVIKYVPELKDAAHWNDITVGSLAGYLGDITTEPFNVGALPGGDIGVAFPGAFPPLEANETSGCIYGANGCSREVFIQNLLDRPPVYLPNTTPAYSNAAFATLGLVLEAAANSSYGDALRNLLVEPLHLNGTTASAPVDLSHAVIPGNASGWDIDISQVVAMGGIFSTPNDLAAIGQAILSSSQLPGSTTRAWLKPTSFTSSLLGAVGRPWEIYRAVTNAEHNRVIDLYTKSGNFGGYGANLVLIPDFEVGFVITMAGQRGTIALPVASVIIDELLPSLDEAARVQADVAFAGTYTASNGLNSTVRLTTKVGVPGLSIEEWISNGTDLRSEWLLSPKWFQMYPTNIVSEDGKAISWRSTSIALPDTGSPFYACPSWVALDRPNYGIYGVDEFVFHLGDNGRAVGLEPRALKTVLKKV